MTLQVISYLKLKVKIHFNTLKTSNHYFKKIFVIQKIAKIK